MPHATNTTDAQYFFELFFDTGPVTLNVLNIAAARGQNPSLIQNKLRQIKNRNPRFQVTGSRTASNAVLTPSKKEVAQATPKPTSAPSRKKTARPQDAADGRKSTAVNRRRTRSASRAADGSTSESEGEREEVKAKQRPRFTSRAPKATVADSKGVVSAISKLNKLAAKATNQSESNTQGVISISDGGSDKENEEEERESKPSPKTRGARKSVGRELEDAAPELPKPAPRGRNATVVRALAAEQESDKSLTENAIVETIEAPEKSSCTKVKNTEFVKNLIAKTSTDSVAGVKRHRTPSPTPIIESEHAVDENLQGKPTENDCKGHRVDGFPSPPDTPTKAPPAKKQKLDHDTSDVINQLADVAVETDITASTNVQEPIATSLQTSKSPSFEAMGDENQGGNAQIKPLSDPAAKVEFADETIIEKTASDSADEGVSIGGAVGFSEPANRVDKFVLPSFGEEEQKDNSVPPQSMPEPQPEKVYKLFPWQEYDPDAIPDIRL